MHDGVSRGVRLCGGVAGEGHEAIDEGYIFGAGLDEARLGLEVVVAVGEAEAGGVDLGDALLRVVDVGGGGDVEGDGEIDGLEGGDGGLERGGVVDAVDLLEEGL